MEEGTSFLFSGVNFNWKKFTTDFSRFQHLDKQEPNNQPKCQLLGELCARAKDLSQIDFLPEQPVVPVKKRKRKGEGVEGISVFKTSKPAKAAKAEKEKPGKELTEQKKKLNRQLERDSLTRNKYNIHVSGNNIPSPLDNYADLTSSCYQMTNLKPYVVY